MVTLCLIPVYVLFSIYICRWLLRWLYACHSCLQKKWVMLLVILGYTAASSTVLLGFLMQPGEMQRIMKRFGNYWLGILLYIFLVVVAADLLRFLIKKSKKVPKEFRRNRRTMVYTGMICLSLITGISLYGIYNASKVRMTSYEVCIEKEAGDLKTLKIALAADFHLGYSIGASHMEKMAERINAMDADLVLFAGDIFDNEYEAIEEPEEIIRILRTIKSKYGVYACYGNHDIEEKILVGFTFPSKEKKQSDPRMDELLEKANVTLLRDEAVLIENSFYLVGRPDYSKPGRGITKRKTPEEIMKELDQKKPVIILEHEPKELKELQKVGADMQLCGHTHDGQVWPGSLLIRLFWENPYGYQQFGSLHSIVTSGVGVYGPAMRVDSKSEVCEITVRFQG